MIKLEDVQRGYERWAAKPHNAKWVRRLDGTPIANDIVVNIFEALKESAALATRDATEEPVAKQLGWVSIGNVTFASTPFGSYEVRPSTTWFSAEFPYELATPGENIETTSASTIVEGKADAQADYERRVLACLRSRPLPLPSEEKMREALEPVDDSPKSHVVGIKPGYQDGYIAGLKDGLSKLGDQIAALKLHPATDPEYDAGYIAARNDAFAIVQEAIDNAD